MYIEYSLWKTWFSQAPSMLWLVLQVLQQKSWFWQPWRSADLQNGRPWWDSPNVCVSAQDIAEANWTVWLQYILFVCLIFSIMLTIYFDWGKIIMWAVLFMGYFSSSTYASCEAELCEIPHLWMHMKVDCMGLLQGRKCSLAKWHIKWDLFALKMSRK